MTPLELAAMVDRLTPQLSDGTVETANQAIALVPALMAENQRIRRELETLIDTLKHETWLHDDEGRFPEVVQMGSYTTSQLTRILKGEQP